MQKHKYVKKISELYYHKNTQLGLNLVCIFIMVKFAFTILQSIYGVIIYDIYHHFDYLYQEKIVEKNLYTHSVLLYMPIFFSFLAIIKRKIELKDFTLSLIFSYMAVKFQWFDIVHNLIKETFIFDVVRAKGRMVINNQYTRIILYFLLIIILLIQVMIKKYRTLSRIMILLITSSCIFTVTIFHIAIPMGMFKSVLQDKTQTQKYEIQYTNKDILCKTRNCYYLYENGKIEIISEIKKSNNFNQYEWAISKGMYILKNTKEDYFSEAVNVNAGFLFDYDILTMRKEKEKDKYFTTIDNISVRKFSRESEIMFSFLAIVAHSIWIFGGLALLEFHYYKFRNRINHKEKKEEK